MLQGKDATWKSYEQRTFSLKGQTLQGEGDYFGEPSEGQSFEEKAGFMARVGARLGEVARSATPRKLTAGLAAATVALGGVAELGSKDVAPADAAKRPLEPMNPKKIGILITATNSYYPGAIKPRIAVMTPTKRIIKGPCNPNNRHNPGKSLMKTVLTPTVKKDYTVYCDGFKKTDDWSTTPENLLARQLIRLGDRLAKAAGVTEDMHGDAVKIRSNSSVAVLRFKRPEASELEVTKPVKTITFKNRGKPRIVKYPKAQ